MINRGHHASGRDLLQEKIAIMTDSTSDIPQHIVEQYNIQIVPLRILFGDQEYKDRLEISADEVYARLSTEVPTTSLPAPGGDVLAIFERLKEEGFTHVVAIHISSGLSGTAQMIENLARGVQGLIIRVIDSKNISMGLGYTVIEAARKLAKDADFEAVCDHVQTMLKKMKVFCPGDVGIFTEGGVESEESRVRSGKSCGSSLLSQSMQRVFMRPMLGLGGARAVTGQAICNRQTIPGRAHA